MPVNNGKVSRPVSISDIATAIGLDSQDLGTLCRSALVNMFSKYKSIIPFGQDTPEELTEAQFKAANFGLIINGYNGFKVDGAWAHNRPGTTVMFRDLDFGGPPGADYGYDHNEEAPLKSISSDQTWNKFASGFPAISGSIKFKTGGQSYPQSVNSRLNVEDLAINNYSAFSLADAYLVMALDSTHYVINGNKLSAGAVACSINLNSYQESALTTYLKSAPAGTYTLYLFLSNRSDAVGWSLPMPVVSSFRLTIQDEFWLNVVLTRVAVAVGSVSVGNYGSTVAHWLTVNVGGATVNAKTYVSGLQDSTVVTMTYDFRITRKTGFTDSGWSLAVTKVLDLTRILAASGATVESMTIHNWVSPQGSITTIEQTVTGTGGYNFANTTGYYNITIVAQGTAAWLKQCAANDSHLPSDAFFSANPYFKYNASEFYPDATNIKGFRFS